MPEISRFLGIVVTMYFNDHDPPHFLTPPELDAARDRG
jgi:hypothetical protein